MWPRPSPNTRVLVPLASSALNRLGQEAGHFCGFDCAASGHAWHCLPWETPLNFCKSHSALLSRPIHRGRTDRIVSESRLACDMWPYCYCGSVAQSSPTLCDSMDCREPGFPVLHHLPEFAQTCAPRVACLEGKDVLASRICSLEIL